ncbi:MAG: sigma-70 family RNA polymerase sigma factor [Candidatus Magnetomorum sp.]|nr:sigma-70 family RNA polymerase sigma factor [Candidatus Magnetomorum sp.]
MTDEILKKEREILHYCIVLGQKEPLVAEYWMLVYNTVRKTYKIHGFSYDEDCLNSRRNEVFIQLFKNDCRKLRQYKEELGKGLAAWIKLIAIQTVQNSFRATIRISKIPIVPIDDINLSNNQEDDENKMAVIEALKRLDSSDKLIIKLFYYKGLTLDDIAIIMKKKKGTIATQKTRAIKKLKKIIQNN